MLKSSGITVERRDAMRIAPQRAEQLRSQRANGMSSRYGHAPVCSNQRCDGECRLCSADAASAALVPDDAADARAKLDRTIQRAVRRNYRATTTPAVVKRTTETSAIAAMRAGGLADHQIRAALLQRTPVETVVRTANDVRRDVRRAKIGAQAIHDAATFRRTMQADERRDPRVYLDGDAVVIPT